MPGAVFAPELVEALAVILPPLVDTVTVNNTRHPRWKQLWKDKFADFAVF